MKLFQTSNIIYFTILFGGLLIGIPLTAKPAPTFERSAILSEIRALQETLEQQKIVLAEQEQVLIKYNNNYSDMPLYETWDATLYQNPENCTNTTRKEHEKLVYKVASYTTLALASIPAVIGPAVEGYRHHITFNVKKESVLLTAFTWPIASAFGNTFFDLHIATNQEEDLLHKILNAVPTTMIVLTSLYTAASLVHFGRKYGFQGGW
ncbi:hypothetical protein [Endozoicomonas numazuensis]|uniref:Uncharacterized protein n=1 Tax=Endozoicomonas numazuensis TaxID=1137799 RepID=A0A081NHM5_9GAMM|nr:hypothetical protein [Endozoicomonas numazuensis]KEQ17948.1 hypothetical protein GZ78_10040 [Endozoicomonas numazuensis]